MIACESVKTICPHVVLDNDFFLVDDRNHDSLGTWKFEPMWHGPSTMCHMLLIGTHDFIDYEGNYFPGARNGLYLKKYYA